MATRRVITYAIAIDKFARLGVLLIEEILAHQSRPGAPYRSYPGNDSLIRLD